MCFVLTAKLKAVHSIHQGAGFYIRVEEVEKDLMQTLFNLTCAKRKEPHS